MKKIFQNNETFEPTTTGKERVFDEVLQTHLGTKAQIVGDVILGQAKKSGLYNVLRPEIVTFLDYFHGLHMWKRFYVSSSVSKLRSESEDLFGDERRLKIMEFANEMSNLVKETFLDGDEGYRQAMTGLGRIIEIFLTWQTGIKASDIPKFEGIKADGDPVVFLQKHYARWIADGRLSQLSLRESDEKLLNALKYELRKSGSSLSDVVPPGIRR